MVETAWLEGFPLNREGVKAKVKRRASDVKDCIENLLSERWLHEVTIPANDRTNSRRSTFLVNLSTEEHGAIRRGGELPPAKLIVPERWKKPGTPSVPVPCVPLMKRTRERMDGGHDPPVYSFIPLWRE